MTAPRACAHCLRLLRRHTCHAHAASSSLRPFSSQLPARQQPPPPHNLPAQDIPSAPPTTTGTVTSNVTVQTPPSKPVSSPSQPSTSSDGPGSAEMQRTIASSLAQGPSTSSLPYALASRLRRSAPKATNTYVAYGITQSLFRTCSLQADYTIPESQRQNILTGEGPPQTSGGEDLGIPNLHPDPDSPAAVAAAADNWWFTHLGLPPTFSTWSQVTYLHMYTLIVRLRALKNKDSASKHQAFLLDHFSHAAEDKMLILHGMRARGIRNRYLKDLFLQWRGLMAAYDEGLVKGDAMLAAAVWRNLWKGDEAVDWDRVAEVVAWMRKAVALLGQVEDDGIRVAVAGEGEEEAQTEAEGRGTRGKENQGVFERARKGVRQSAGRKSAGIAEQPSGEEEEEIPVSP